MIFGGIFRVPTFVFFCEWHRWGQGRLWVHWGPGHPGGLRCFHGGHLREWQGGCFPVFPSARFGWYGDQSSLGLVTGTLREKTHPKWYFPWKMNAWFTQKITPARKRNNHHLKQIPTHDFGVSRCELWKKRASGCWGYMGDYTIQLNGDYFMNH